MIFARGDVFGPYRIEEVVSSGGMAEVYAAVREGHGSFTKRVALKVIRPEYATLPELAEIFQREAQTVADISHPGIAHVYDFGQIDGRLYLAMELVEGVPLSALVDAAERSSTVLPAAVVLTLAQQLLGAIAHLHEARGGAGPILHRDLKPSNVIATLAGSIKVVDFGLARRVGAQPSALTELGGPSGTPRYMAPEQAQGISTTESDVFSLGLVLAELCAAGTGRGVALVRDARAGQPRAVGAIRPDLPTGLDGLVLRAVKLEPSQRYADASAMKRRLADILAGLDLGAASAELGAIVRATLGATGSEAPTAAGPASPRPTPATPPPARGGTPPRAPTPARTPPDSEPRDSIRIAAGAKPAPTAIDLGEPLGPDATCFRHLRDFPGKVKGALVRSVVDQFAADHPELMPAFRDQLVPDFARIVQDGIVPSTWYPEVFFCAVLRGSRRLVPPGSLEEELTSARKVFETMARRYHRLFLRIAGPSRLISMAARTWSLYHTVGKLVIEDSGPGFAAGTLRDNPAMLEAGYAEGSLGAIWGALALAGGRDVTVSLQRRPPSTIAIRLEWK